jgi:hypothetical protein
MSLPSGFLVSTLITDIFAVENQLIEQTYSDLFKAYDGERGRSVGLWICREQFENNDERLTQFVKRMGRFSNVSIRTPKLFSVGLDPSGLLFIVVEYTDGYSITQGNLDMKEAERRFAAALQIVETLHAHGIGLGDIGANSFWLTRTGEIALVGVMGNPAFEGSLESILRADVLALTALCRRLFGSLLQTAPAWIHESLAIAESTDSSAPQSATIFASHFRKIKEKILNEEAQVTQRGERRLEKRSTDNQLQVFDGSGANKEDQSAETSASVQNRKKLLIGVGIFLVLVIALSIGLLLFSNKSEQTLDETQMVLRAVANDRMKQAADILNSQDVQITEKRAKFAELSQSDDPLAHTLLVDAALKSIEPSERLLAEREIMIRAKRFKLGLLADAVKSWLDSVSLADNPPEYELSLKILDGSLPAAARGEIAERIFILNPYLGSKFLSALVLSSDEDIYRTSVSAVIAKMGNSSTLPPINISSKALIGMLLESSPELQPQFAAMVQSCSDDELRWLSTSALQQGKTISSSVLEVVIKRNLFGDTTKAYLHPLLSGEELPEGTLQLISRLLSKEVSKGDVEQLGIWLHADALELLKVLLVDNTDPLIAKDLLDYVAGRSSGNVFIEQLFSLFRKMDPKDRTSFAALVGVTTSSEMVFSKSTVERALQPLKHLEEKNPLFSFLVSAPNQSFLSYYLQEFEKRIPAASMVALLSNPSVEVRKASVHALRNVNNTAVLQVILEAYKAEQNKDVKKIYEEELWVIKERMTK